MSTARTQTSYLSSYSTTQVPPEERKRLRKEERDRGGNVLPKPNSIYSRQSTMNGTMVSNGGGSGSQSGSGALSGRLSGRLAEVKEKHRQNHASSSKSRNDDLSRRNMVLDANGVAHDSEYVQFRTTTPSHLNSQRSPNAFPNDDDSASSSSASSASSSGPSRFPSTAYTSASTYRTTGSNNQYPNKPSSNSASALPSHLTSGNGARRSGYEYGSVQPSSSLLRGGNGDYLGGGGGRSNGEYDSRVGTTKLSSKSRANQQSQFTTSSYQPPAPAFAPRAMDYNTSLRLPTRAAPSSDSNSLAESAARMSLNGASSSGYNQTASNRPTQLEGTALDAGVHGMKRSYDGFKLELSFGAHKVKKKLARKILNL